VRWWMHFDAPYIMSVDNASTKGMDFSALLATNPDLWMVQWTDGKGEIERQDVANDANLNGLREPFIDVTPYAPLFQQFLTRMVAKALLLPQAKKVQTDLIQEVFNSKRQAPFHYAIAAGDYYWDATDATLVSSTVPAIQNLTATLNSLINKVNAVVAALNVVDANLTAQSNVNFNAVTSQGATWAGYINSNVVDPGNSALSTINVIFGQVNTNIVNVMNALLKTGELRFTLPGESNPIIFNAAVPGLTSSGVGGIETNPYALNGLPGMFGLNTLAPGVAAWTNQATVPTSNVQWIPIGASAPVNVTPAEQAAILSGIAARTNDLNVKKNAKVTAVNALTTVPAVIAYDVTTGW
jgi:hypothetical protein